jgi:hypothetical protein
MEEKQRAGILAVVTKVNQAVSTTREAARVPVR